MMRGLNCVCLLPRYASSDHVKRQRLSETIFSKFGVIRSVLKHFTAAGADGKARVDPAGLERTLLPVLMNQAAARGSVRELSSLLELGADPTSTDDALRSPLHLAAAEANVECVQSLLSFAQYSGRAGAAALNRVDAEGNTPLLDAVRNTHNVRAGAVALILRRKGAALMLSIAQQARDLNWLAAAGDAPEIDRRLRLGYNPLVADYDDRTPLHVACSEGRETVAALLLQFAKEHGVLVTAGAARLAAPAAASSSSSAGAASGAVNGSLTPRPSPRTGVSSSSPAAAAASGAAGGSAAVPVAEAAGGTVYLTGARAVLQLLLAQDRYGNTAMIDAYRCGFIRLAEGLEVMRREFEQRTRQV